MGIHLDNLYRLNIIPHFQVGNTGHTGAHPDLPRETVIFASHLAY